MALHTHFCLLICLSFSRHKVPSEAPRDLTATPNTSTSIVTAWQLPVADSHNGIIKGFKLFVRRKGSKDSKKSFQVNGTSNLTKTVPGLNKFTEYEFQVLAFTSVGDGPMSAVIVAITKEDGERCCKMFLPLY